MYCFGKILCYQDNALSTHWTSTFKVRELPPDDAIGEDGGSSAGQRKFNHADLHKMHAYRDAIPAARTVWVLYPGDLEQFWPENDGDAAEGVGVIGLAPTDACGGKLVRRLLGVAEV